MSEDRSSFVSNNPRAAYVIEELGSEQENQPSENNHRRLHLTLSNVGFHRGFVPFLLNLIPHRRELHHYEPDLDTISLIDTIGRDMTIQCLLRCPRATYGSIASLNRSFRELIRSGELYQLRHDNNVIEHWVYFSFHLATWEAFDPSSKKWMQLPVMNVGRCSKASRKETMAVGTELLVVSDYVTIHFYKYSLLTNSWSLAPAMNTPRSSFGSASLCQTAIFAGGVHRRTIVDTVELYDSRSGNWEVLPSLIKPRSMCSGVYMDGKFYVIGGVGNGNKWLTCGEEYDLDTKIWTEIPNMSPVDGYDGWDAPPMVAVVGNELYAADYAKRELKKYDKKKKEWEVIGRLPERVQSEHGLGTAFRGCGGRLVIAGGPQGNDSNVVEIYSWKPSEGPPEWSMIGQKKSASYVYNSTVMGC